MKFLIGGALIEGDMVRALFISVAQYIFCDILFYTPLPRYKNKFITARVSILYWQRLIYGVLLYSLSTDFGMWIPFHPFIGSICFINFHLWLCFYYYSQKLHLGYSFVVTLSLPYTLLVAYRAFYALAFVTVYF